MMDEYASHDEPSPHAPFIAFRYNRNINPTRRQLAFGAPESAGQGRTKVSGPDYSAHPDELDHADPKGERWRWNPPAAAACARPGGCSPSCCSAASP